MLMSQALEAELFQEPSAWNSDYLHLPDEA